MSVLLLPALVCPLTSLAVWPVIYVCDHLVGPGCQWDLQINTLSPAFPSELLFTIQTQIVEQTPTHLSVPMSFASLTYDMGDYSDSIVLITENHSISYIFNIILLPVLLCKVNIIQYTIN